MLKVRELLTKEKMKKKRKMRKMKMKRPLMIAELTKMKCISPDPPHIPEESPPEKMLAPSGSAKLAEPQAPLPPPKGDKRN